MMIPAKMTISFVIAGRAGWIGFCSQGDFSLFIRLLLYWDWVDLYIILNVLTSLTDLASLNIAQPGVDVMGSRNGVIVNVGGCKVLVGVVSQRGTSSSVFG